MNGPPQHPAPVITIPCRPDYSIVQIAEMFGVVHTTVLHWISSGRLVTFRRPDRGLPRHYVRFVDFMAFLADYADRKRYAIGLIPERQRKRTQRRVAVTVAAATETKTQPMSLPVSRVEIELARKARDQEARERRAELNVKRLARRRELYAARRTTLSCNTGQQGEATVPNHNGNCNGNGTGNVLRADPSPEEIRAAVNELRREKGLPEV